MLYILSKPINVSVNVNYSEKRTAMMRYYHQDVGRELKTNVEILF